MCIPAPSPLSACARIPVASPGGDRGGISPLLYFATASLLILRTVGKSLQIRPPAKGGKVWERSASSALGHSRTSPRSWKELQAAKKIGREQCLVLSSPSAWIVSWPEGSPAELSVPSLSRSVCIPREDGGRAGARRGGEGPSSVRSPAEEREGCGPLSIPGLGRILKKRKEWCSKQSNTQPRAQGMPTALSGLDGEGMSSTADRASCHQPERWDSTIGATPIEPK